jgi:hypothetical protein
MRLSRGRLRAARKLSAVVDKSQSERGSVRTTLLSFAATKVPILGYLIDRQDDREGPLHIIVQLPRVRSGTGKE